jgi:membrane protein implicated in regulation of membrane protease activity
MEYMPFFWIAVIVLSVFAEVNTAALVAIWFMPSALVATVLAFFKVPIYVQVLVFVVLSALFIVFSKVIFSKTLLPKHTPTNADSVIGEHAVVTEQVCNMENRGLVKVRGQIWSARSADGTLLEPGEIVSVISIEGVKLICRK